MQTRKLTVELPEQMWSHIDRLIKAHPHCNDLDDLVDCGYISRP